MKKYEIIKTGLDDYMFKYKDKEIPFKSDVNITRQFQLAEAEAETQMILDLAKRGLSIKKLNITETKDGKTYEDHTNEIALKEIYKGKEMEKVFNKICKEKLGIELIPLLLELDLTDEEQIKFVEELGGAFVGKTP